MAEQSEAAALQSAADARQAEAAARGVVYVMIDKEVTEVSCAGAGRSLSESSSNGW